MVLAGKVSEVPEQGVHLVYVAGHAIVLVKAGGTMYACQSECPHQGAPLKDAVVNDAEHIRCLRHDYLFSLKNGRCLSHPKCTLRIYPVEVRGDDIYVDLA